MGAAVEAITAPTVTGGEEPELLLMCRHRTLPCGCSSLLVSYKRRGEWRGGRRARREGRQMAAVAAESEGKERGRGSSGGVGEGGCGGGEGIDGQTGRPTLSRHYVGMVDFYAGPRWRPKHGTNAPRVVLARPEAQQGSTAH
jgi:hypothetical protein